MHELLAFLKMMTSREIRPSTYPAFNYSGFTNIILAKYIKVQYLSCTITRLGSRLTNTNCHSLQIYYAQILIDYSIFSI